VTESHGSWLLSLSIVYTDAGLGWQPVGQIKPVSEALLLLGTGKGHHSNRLLFIVECSIIACWLGQALLTGDSSYWHRPPEFNQGVREVSNFAGLWQQ